MTWYVKAAWTSTPAAGKAATPGLGAFGLGLSTNPDHSAEGEYFIEVFSGFERPAEIENYTANCRETLCSELIDSPFGYENSPFTGGYYDLTLVDDPCPGF